MRVDTTHVHPDDRALFDELSTLAIRAATRFRLPLRVIEHKRRPLWDGAMGLCYIAEGRISIVFRARARAEEGGGWSRRPLSEPQIITTIAHELAHLAYRGHGPLHRELTGRINHWLTYERHPESTPTWGEMIRRS